MIAKPTKKQYKELKDFKLRVSLAIHNAYMLQNINDFEIPYVVMIGKATFTLDPASWQSRGWSAEEEIKTILNRFTTTKW